MSIIFKISQHVHSTTLCYEIVNKTNFRHREREMCLYGLKRREKIGIGEPSVFEDPKNAMRVVF